MSMARKLTSSAIERYLALVVNAVLYNQIRRQYQLCGKSQVARSRFISGKIQGSLSILACGSDLRKPWSCLLRAVCHKPISNRTTPKAYSSCSSLQLIEGGLCVSYLFSTSFLHILSVSLMSIDNKFELDQGGDC